MNPIKAKKTERSFTLLETIIALAILTATVLQLVGSQGKIVYFSDYTRRIDEASWLAKRIMSQVEYNWTYHDFKDLEVKETNKKFEELPDSDYTYDLEIKEWKFPILDFLAGGGPSSAEEGEKKPASGGADMVGQMLEQVLGKDILKIAYVEVFWPEGAKRNSVTLAYLLTNQRKIDEELKKLEPAWTELENKMKKEDNVSEKDNEPKTKAECDKANRIWKVNVCLPPGSGVPNPPPIPGTENN